MRLNPEFSHCLLSRRRALAGLGFNPLDVLDVGSKLFSGSGPTSNLAPQPPGTSVQVSPTIQTQVSPMISPVFQQAFQPSGSPMTAGTAQTIPTAQTAPQAPMPLDQGGALPGAYAPPSVPYTGASYRFPPLPAELESREPESDFRRYLPIIVIGGLGVAAVVFFMRQRQG